MDETSGFRGQISSFPPSVSIIPFTFLFLAWRWWESCFQPSRELPPCQTSHPAGCCQCPPHWVWLWERRESGGGDPHWDDAELYVWIMKQGFHLLRMVILMDHYEDHTLSMLCFYLFFPDITEIGRCAKAYCEHTARSIPTLSDTVISLIEMGESWRTLIDYTMTIQQNISDVIECVCVSAGFSVDTLPVYAKRSQRMVITARE